MRQGFYLPVATHGSQTSKLVAVMEHGPGSSHISTRSLLGLPESLKGPQGRQEAKNDEL